MAEPSKTRIEISLAKTGSASTDEASRTSAVVDKAVAADPALMNELNLEPWWQSGVGVFGAGGVLWALGAILTEVGTHGLDIGAYDFGLMVTAIGSLASMVGVLYRRFWPGLKPMFYWWGGQH